MSLTRRALWTCALLACHAAVPSASLAQEAWPTKPITLVVPFATGGSADILARVLTGPVGEILKQPVVVDVRAGAGGLVGTQAVAKSPADGHTLLLTTDSLYAINPALHGRSAEEAIAALGPVIHVAEAPLVIAVSSDSPVNDFPGFLSWAKSRPGGASYATPGVGTDHHLLGELIAKVSGVPMNHVPYRGAGAALGDLAGKQVDSLITLVSTVQPLLASGKAKMVAVASSEPYPPQPQLSRTVQTLKGTDMLVSYSIMAPAATPPAVIERLNAAFNAALRQPAVSGRIAELGFTPTGGTVRAFAQRMRAERQQREAIIRDANVRLAP